MIIESDEYVKPEHPAYDGYTIRRVTKQIADLPDYTEWEVLHNGIKVDVWVKVEGGTVQDSPYKSMGQAKAAIQRHMEICGIPKVLNEAFYDSNGERVPSPHIRPDGYYVEPYLNPVVPEKEEETVTNPPVPNPLVFVLPWVPSWVLG